MIRERLAAALGWVVESCKLGAVVICAAAILGLAIEGLMESCGDNEPPRTSGCEERR